MRYAVIGGDVRFAHLTAMLNESGRPAQGFLLDRAGAGRPPLEELKESDAVISNWPMRWPLSDTETSVQEILGYIAPGTTMLLCGPGFPVDGNGKFQYVNLWEDEQLLQENAWLTAEAAVATAVRALGASMRGIKCAVIGYGRIGRALTEILLNADANVCVFTGSEVKAAQICESGAEAASMAVLNEKLPDRKLVFSTPPACVLDEVLLRCAARDVIIMDLASFPYGVDLDAAHKLGLRASREPGLPGRFCPVSAARAIYHALLRWEEKV